MKCIFILMSMAAAVLTAVADPTVDGVSASLSANDNIYTVSYTLAGAPAIVTVDVKTNGVSIGGEHIVTLSGDINMPVKTDGAKSFTWDVGRDWDVAAIGTIPVDIVITAWTSHDPPDVMVLDLLENSSAPVKYYENESFLPGGLLANTAYRTSQMVFKLCRTRGKSLQRGTPTSGVSGRDNNQYLFKVNFTNHYYMGVFEMTHGQWLTVVGSRRNDQFYTQDWELRPVLSISTALLREDPSFKFDANTTAEQHPCCWPKKPAENSPLGIIRKRTGVWVDLPSESQWEVACRAGSEDFVYPNGAAITGAASDTNFPDRYKHNGGLIGSYTRYNMPESTPAKDGGTSKAGFGEPNAWGLYDMYGNVGELCMDSWKYDPRNYDTGDPYIEGGSKSWLVRGASWVGDAGLAPSQRNTQGPQGNNNAIGVRLMVREGL